MDKKYIDILKASEELSKGGTAIINRGDAEECVDEGLVEPLPGYPLTEKGRQALREHEN